MNPEQAHGVLRNVLLNGRILLNGMSLTANEISGLLQGEQMLFEKAIQFEESQKAKKPPQKENVIPFKKGKK